MTAAVGAATGAQGAVDAVLGRQQRAVAIAAKDQNRQLEVVEALCIEEWQHGCQQLTARWGCSSGSICCMIAGQQQEQ